MNCKICIKIVAYYDNNKIKFVYWREKIFFLLHHSIISPSNDKIWQVRGLNPQTD
ncbi:MAG: hypothetical protein LBM26_05285 [Methanobrevibacter sp.]|nr:hypothetical protein [Methanobrevibacter sp.]